MQADNQREQAQAAACLSALEAAVFNQERAPPDVVVPALGDLSPPPPAPSSPVLFPAPASSSPAGNLNTEALPVGGHLKPALKAQICSGAYVDFPSLHPEAEEPAAATVTIDQSGFQRIVSVVGGAQR